MKPKFQRTTPPACGAHFRTCMWSPLQEFYLYLLKVNDIDTSTVCLTWSKSRWNKALQPNLDSPPRSEPTLELHSRAMSSVGINSLFQWSQHRTQFWRKAEKNNSEYWSIIWSMQSIQKIKLLLFEQSFRPKAFSSTRRKKFSEFYLKHKTYFSASQVTVL